MSRKIDAWLTLVIATCYVLAFLYYALKKLLFGSEFNIKDAYLLVVFIGSCAAGYRALVLVSTTHSLHKEKVDDLGSNGLTVRGGVTEGYTEVPNSFELAFKKRPWTFVSVFTVAFSLPVLFQLSAAKAEGRSLSAGDWWVVIGSEIIICICMVVAWHRVKDMLRKR